jgi:hypothetical protein
MRSSNVLARSVAALLFVLVFAACAHGGGSAAGDPAAVKSVVIPPRITQQQNVLRFRTRSGRFRGTVEVPVDETGRAEIFRIRVIPRMDDLMRRDIEEWLQGVTFIPAKRDGVPVAGVFKMSFR